MKSSLFLLSLFGLEEWLLCLDAKDTALLGLKNNTTPTVIHQSITTKFIILNGSHLLSATRFGLLQVCRILKVRDPRQNAQQVV